MVKISLGSSRIQPEEETRTSGQILVTPLSMIYHHTDLTIPLKYLFLFFYLIPDTTPSNITWTPIIFVLSGGADAKHPLIGALAEIVGSIPGWGST